MKRCSALSLLLLFLVGGLAQTKGKIVEKVENFAETHGVIVGKPDFTPVISPKKDWYVLFTTAANPNFGECEKVLCGGALVAQDMILTAAHCFDKALKGEINNPETFYTAWVGRQAMTSENGDIGKKFSVNKVYLDLDNYNPDDEFNKHDYALVKIIEFGRDGCDDSDKGVLADNTVFATYGQTTPTSSNITDVIFDSFGNVVSVTFEYGDFLDLYGFGRYFQLGVLGPTSPKLLRANATKFNDTICDAWYDFDDYNSTIQFCVGPSMSCYGDSGGALFLGDDIVGVTSYIIQEPGGAELGLCTAYLDFYTKVQAYSPFIYATICGVSVSPPASCRFGIHDKDVLTAIDFAVPSTFEKMAQTAQTALTTVTRSARLFWGYWFN